MAATINLMSREDGYSSCDVEISKEQWFELLQDSAIVGKAMDALLKFFRSSEHKSTCKGVTEEGSPQSANAMITAFAKRVGKKLNINVIGSDGKQTFWPIPMKEGRLLSDGHYEWTLRDELAEAIKDWLILDLLKRYKEAYLSVPLDHNGADELYKWQLITECEGKSELDIIQKFKTKNIVDVARVNQLLTTLSKDQPQQLANNFALLTNEDVPLSDRLSDFKSAMGELCGDKFNVKANDERTASAFLACWNPNKYTFYKDEIYQNYCNYINAPAQKAGNKYPHYLQLLGTLVQTIRQDAELADKFAKETDGLVQSDLLTAQNILWQMKDLIVNKEQYSFWSGGIKWDQSETDKLDDFNNAKCWKIGWERESDTKGAKQAWQNIKKVKIDDYLAFHGYGGKNDLTIYQISRVVGKDEERGEVYFEKISEPGDELYKGKAPKLKEGGWFGTLFPITGDDAINKIFGKYINNKKNNMNSEVQKLTSILSLKKNIILQGAPGTGKTYNTAALALAICGIKDGEKFSVIENNINKEYVMDYSKHDIVMKRYEQMRYDKKNNPDGQIGFCTFHQSMDYEDFVEGIKPVKPDEGELYYKVESGIFRMMCKNALNPKQVKQEKSLDLAFDDLVQDIVDGKVKTIPLKNGGMSNLLSVSPQLTIKWKTANHELDVNCVSKERLLKLCESFDSKEDFETMTNINKAIRKEIGGCNASYYWAVAHYLLETIDIDYYDVIPQNHVLIIDEINRGNVSKIFGELITLLEADKRIGGDHPIQVTLPYSKESFGVPSNLYIIGTMNTTDRSVGNIDYAVRRRFAFATLKADRDVLIGKYAIDSIQVKLFDAVYAYLNDQNKHPEMEIDDLMVGHSYFFAKDENELELKWQYEILPLLNEYVKDGIINAKAINSDVTVADFLLA